MCCVIAEKSRITRQVTGLLELPDGSQARLGDHVLVRRQQLLQVLVIEENQDRKYTLCSRESKFSRI